MIVLCTDFGLEGPYSGQVKAVLARSAPAVPVIDLFADLPAFRPRLAAYLLAAYGERPAVLVTDPNTAGVYDTVYVDLDDDHSFVDEKPVTKDSPASYRDMNGDGLTDLSGGLLYYISDGATRIPGGRAPRTAAMAASSASSTGSTRASSRSARARPTRSIRRSGCSSRRPGRPSSAPV